MTERMFPVLRGADGEEYDRLGCPREVPWSALAPHEEWALRNHSQNLETLALRGGLGPDEMAAIVTHMHWSKAPPLIEAIAILRSLRLPGPP